MSVTEIESPNGNCDVLQFKHLQKLPIVFSDVLIKNESPVKFIKFIPEVPPITKVNRIKSIKRKNRSNDIASTKSGKSRKSSPTATN